MLIIPLILLFVKHFIWDFLYQPPYMWQNKGTFLHPGGLLHAGLHAGTSYLILSFFMINPLGALILASLEFVLHYAIDWAKMNINRTMEWKCNTHNEFWILTGLDQLLHSLTYIAMIGIIAF